MAGQHMQAASAAVAAWQILRHQSAYKVKILPWYGLGEQTVLPGKGCWW
jgi:hypothetical protein